MKRVLLLSYSHTGQTDKALDELAKGFSTDTQVDRKTFEVAEHFPFPWTFTGFFRLFPRCVLGKAPAMKSFDTDFSQYDLIVLAGQVWFLSPSLPLQSFLKSGSAGQLADKNVLVVLTCRNMWHSAARLLKENLLQLKANYFGQITICEISPLWASFVTTPRWLLTGKKEAFAFFPAAGIADSEFKKLSAVGRDIGQKLGEAQPTGLPLVITNQDRYSIRLMEAVGRRFFEGWARVIEALAPREGKPQDLLLVLFRVTLVLLILLLVPTTKTIEVLHNKLLKN